MSIRYQVTAWTALLLCLAAWVPSGRVAAAPARGSGSSMALPAVRVRGNQLLDAAGRRVRLLGVDIDGTESACVQGARVWQAPLDAGEARDIAAWGANAVRVPLNEDCWLGINGLPKHYPSTLYRREIEQLVGNLNAAGIVAILDLQWSAPGARPSTNLWPMPDAAHAVAFWSSVASTFKAVPGVVFDLFNEPSLGLKDPTRADWDCWRNGCTADVSTCPQAHTQPRCGTTTFGVAGMQQLLDAVRAAGAHQPVMVGGLDWSGDPCGTAPSGGARSAGAGASTSGTGGAPAKCMWLIDRPSDPDHQLIASFHTYNTTVCNTVSCWDDSVAPVAKKVPVVTGELGAKECSSNYVTSYMHWADEHGISYLVWAWNLPSPGESCAQQGTRLITAWTGTTNDSSPVARAVQGHLREELRSEGVRT